ncbi:MAG TPA: NAD(P)/FAD-dependent oxidoreductase [Verrucomicrobiae bacterium]|jgi:NADH dehydrogenase|nr:NAD(P)/FAD-dependent oxidoreductase [Verrucomicrobiae bacterium]
MASGAHIVVLGAGFGGLEFCERFRHPAARITLVDRTNHHLFQPLLYQVATAGLSAPDIAQPIRSILSRKQNVSVLMESVADFKLAEKKVVLAGGELSYDFLVLALGGCTSYFGHPEWESFAPGLKSLEDALRIRARVLLAFEKAEAERSPEEQERLMTVLIVGAGPTGVELAGAFAELTRKVLRSDFRHIDSAKAHIVLVEGGSAILPHLAPDLSASAQEQLEALGVRVRLNTLVKNLGRDRVEFDNGEIIRAENIFWTAGVAANPLTKKLGVELDRAGRVKVNSDLSLPGHPEVFAIGDMALVLGSNGKPVPGVSPAAMQMARHTARIIEAQLASPANAKRPPFKYFDKGTMATIGRSAAVAEVGKLHFSGFLAWMAWLMVHLIFLVGFRNKLSVLFQWFYSYITYKRGARIVVGGKENAQ